MKHQSSAEILASLLDPPNQLIRARAALRNLRSLHDAATADALWWRGRGHLSDREAQRVRAAFILCDRVQEEAPAPAFTDPGSVARAVARLRSAAQEELWAVSVDSGLRLVSRTRVAQGGRASCSVSPREVLRAAVVDQAAGLFLVHNHPSGDPQPSDADRRFTGQVRRGASALGLCLHDHIVMAGDRWVSELTGTRGVTSASEGSTKTKSVHPTPSSKRRSKERSRLREPDEGSTLHLEGD